MQKPVDNILKIAPKYGFPVFDMFRNLGIDFNNPSDYERFSIDGLHFNDEGNIRIADTIIKYLESL